MRYLDHHREMIRRQACDKSIARAGSAVRSLLAVTVGEYAIAFYGKSIAQENMIDTAVRFRIGIKRIERAVGSQFYGRELISIPQHTGAELVAAHTRFTACFPWRTRQGTMNALDTHDTPRFATTARPGAVPVALGLSATLPGIPVVFAGDEFGLTGIDGEASRTPIPWGDPEAEPWTALNRESRIVA